LSEAHASADNQRLSGAQPPSHFGRPAAALSVTPIATTGFLGLPGKRRRFIH